MCNLICPVCRDLLFDPQELTPGTVEHGDVAVIFCGHLFHLYCLITWFAAEKAAGRQCSCPSCKDKSSYSDITLVYPARDGEEDHNLKLLQDLTKNLEVLKANLQAVTEAAAKNEESWNKIYLTLLSQVQILDNLQKDAAITKQSIKEEKEISMISLQTALMCLPITVDEEVAAQAFAKSVGNGRNGGLQSVVVLYIPRGKVYSPGFELFQLQLATYLRMCEIRHACQMLSTDELNKVPVMNIGGTDLFRPQICCAVIKEYFYRQTKIHVQMQMLYTKTIPLTTIKNILHTILWGLLIWQWIHNEGKTMQIIPQNESIQFSFDLKNKLNKIACEQMKNWGKKMLFREVSKGIKSLSEQLGSKDYFSGPFPGETDASAFVLLSQLLWNCEGSPFEKEVSKYENLLALVGRIKRQFWTEWDIGSALPHSWN